MSFIFFLLFIVAIVGVFKPYKDIKRSYFGIAAFVSFLLMGVFGPIAPASNLSNSETPKATESNSPDSTNTAAESKSGWQYSEQEDKMRGTSGHTARLDASDTIQLDFPYGEQRPFLGVRQSPKFGFDVYFAVDSGQIMCNTYENSYINIKFDDGPIERFRCVDAEHGNNDIAFFKDAKRLLAKLKNSKKAVVEADFYQKGRVQVNFDTAGLQWK